MMPKCKVCVFDLDDTLYKEVDYVKSAFAEIAASLVEGGYERKSIFNLMWNTYRAGGNAFAEASKIFHDNRFGVESMIEMYRNHIPDIRLNDDVRSTLLELQSRQVTLGIITDGRQRQQSNKVKALRLTNFVSDDDVIINSEVDRMKPDHRSFCHFQEKYGTDSIFYYIADNPVKDFIAPNRLGWTTICLIDTNQVNIHSQVFVEDLEAMPQYKIKNLADLLLLI